MPQRLAPAGAQPSAPEPSEPPIEPAGSREPDADPPRLTIATKLELIEQAIRRRAVLRIDYTPADGPPAPRDIRPLLVARHGMHWYLTAYCSDRRAERCFRLDRIGALELRTERLAPAAAAAQAPRRKRIRAMSQARSGFFVPPPDPPPNSPLVRIWLE